MLLRLREARHKYVPNDAIYKKNTRLRYGDRNQVSGFWVRAVVDRRGAKRNFLGRWKYSIA